MDIKAMIIEATADQARRLTAPSGDMAKARALFEEGWRVYRWFTPRRAADELCYQGKSVAMRAYYGTPSRVIRPDQLFLFQERLSAAGLTWDRGCALLRELTDLLLQFA